MPELPEVETSRRGIEPHILNQKAIDIIIRQKQLRWPIPGSLKTRPLIRSGDAANIFYLLPMLALLFYI